MVSELTILPKEWDFLAQGMANCVLRYSIQDCAKQQDKFVGKVLRLRKESSLISSAEVVAYINEHIRCHFHKNEIVQMQLVQLESSVLVEISKRIQIKLNLLEPHGILMPDLFPAPPVETIGISKHIKLHLLEQENFVLEFKPKWLYAPPVNFKRCRNCALNLFRNGKSFSDICPLKLLQLNSISSWCESLLERIKEKETYHKFYSIEQSLESAITCNHETIQTLYNLQNPESLRDIHEKILNLNSEADVTPDLLLSMTLKDVSMFIFFSSANETSSVKIIDLDKKPASKFAKWKDQEAKLASYYTDV